MEKKGGLVRKIVFGFSSIPDQLTYQAFTYLVFTFYYTIIRLNILEMLIGYTIWAIWNAVNDPLLGSLSDRTKTSFGRRRLYISIAIVPLCLMMVLLFTVPIFLGSQLINFVYFMVIIMVFEFIYTMYSVNVNALFPEMFPNEKERATTNLFVKGLTIFALCFAFAVPNLIITPLVPDITTSPAVVASLPFQYAAFGFIAMIVTGVAAAPFVLFGIKEKKTGVKEIEKGPSFWQSMKITMKNKTFVIFVCANMLIWYLFGMFPTILPLFGTYVLGITKNDQFLIVGLPLIIALLFAAACFPLHRYIGRKFGMRNGLILTSIVWAITLIPFALVYVDPLGIMRLIFIPVIIIQGFGLSGAMYYVDIIISDIIDEDEVKTTGVRREGSYYGMNAFIHRISIILRILSIFLVFSGMGWGDYNPHVNNPFLLHIGLKLLMVVFPIIALTGAVLLLLVFPLHGKKLEEVQKEVAKIRAQKTE
ncbi:MAG: MFS transporter [Candidatus Helarchaeota archaeon]